MRIAYVVADPGIPFSGSKGASVHVRSITEAIAGLGHEVICFAARPGEGPIASTPVAVRPVVLDGVLADLIAALAGRCRSPEARLLRRRELAGLCLNDPFRRRVEEDHRLRPFDVLLERYSLWSLAGARLARDLSVPFLLEVNAPLPEEARRYRSLHLGPVARAIRSRVLREADGVIAVSREVAAMSVREGADPRRVTVVPNGVDPALFQAVERTGVRGGVMVIGFLGSLKPWHGLEVLCRAFAAVAREERAARLMVVGDGPLRGRLERFAGRARLRNRVDLVGSVPHSQVPELLRRFDIAVAPYPDRDGFYFSPLKIFEYMACGLPIVASRVGQISEVLEDGRTGLLVPPGDAGALAGAIRKLLGDAGLRQALGGQAAILAGDRFGWRDAARQVVDCARRVQAERMVQHAS